LTVEWRLASCESRPQKTNHHSTIENRTSNIVFMGTPEFAVPSLRALADAGYAPEAVVTGPDRRRGRGQSLSPTAVKQAAQELGVARILQPESVHDDAFAEQIAALDPDVIAVVAFKILPPAVYERAGRGAFNLHASLLPRYRGAAPINRSVMDGASETGVTTFLLEPTVDTGAILVRKRLGIGPDETAGSVHDRLAELGAEAVVETVRQLETGTADPQPQDDAEATPAPKLSKDEGHIPWHEPARVVHDHVRGLSPYPGAFAMHDGTRLKAYRSRVAETGATGEPGEVLDAAKRLVVACGEGAVMLTEVQQPGKKRMDAADFLNGYDLAPGDVLS
jgi:methionyl-tRNA formyltransferase